ncbi:MAG: S-layer homology domain-containing protein [Clostridia bacterium]|nr:S-layer homology domain-containing protein [Clostridia bacterium]
MKKLLSIVLAVLLLHTSAFASFYDVAQNTEVGQAVQQLTKLGIISGYTDGSFHPNDKLTRAQMSRIAVAMLGENTAAQTRSGNSVFADVDQSHWANGYINYISELGIISGYPDGTFCADQVINYAQLLTILVRLLGYTGEDVAYKWPDGYINKAKALNITEEIEFSPYEEVTRGNAAYLIYNALSAEKNSNSNISLMSKSSKEDIIIYGNSSVDASLAAGTITTTGGSYKLSATSTIDTDDFGKLGTLYLDNEGKAIAFVPEKENARSITISSAAYNADTNTVEITFTENGNTKTESFNGNAGAYYSGKSSSISEAVNEMEAGREALLFYTDAGAFTRIYLKESTLEGPMTVQNNYSDVYSLFTLPSGQTPKVIRDGRNAELTDIKMYDVLYYMKSINTIYAYTDKVSGTYEKAYPIKASVTSVTVAGKEYSLSTQKAVNKMNETDGAFALGERVTLLLGRTGEVVDVISAGQSGALDIAVVTNSYSEISAEQDTEGQRIRYVSLVMPDGSATTYKADKDYTDYIGSVVKIAYENEIASLQAVAPNVISGKFDSYAPSLDGHLFADDYTILELVDLPTSGEATVKKIEVHDIDVTSLTKNQVIHAQVSGSTKDISFLYVKNVTKSSSQFGVVTQALSSNQYTVLYKSTTKNISTAYKVSAGDGVEVILDGSSASLKPLIRLDRGAVEGYESGKIRVNSKTYMVSDYVEIYGGKLSSKFSSMSVEEMLSDNTVSVTLYSDQTAQNGGVVRVIVVQTKI